MESNSVSTAALPLCTGARGCTHESAKHGTLLLVDDDAAVRRTLAALLELCGYRVIAAASGAAALELVRDRALRVSALVTDLHMPQMSGVQLAARLMAMGLDVPVLFLSGQTDADLPVSWHANVPRRFLPKPFTPDMLARELDQLLCDR